MGMNVNLDDAAGSGEEGETSEAVVAEINITPLTDVFLVLLIIFMVTTTAVVDAEKANREGVKVALPKANAAGPVTKKRSDPVLTITKNGELYLFAKRCSPRRCSCAGTSRSCWAPRWTSCPSPSARARRTSPSSPSRVGAAVATSEHFCHSPRTRPRQVASQRGARGRG